MVHKRSTLAAPTLADAPRRRGEIVAVVSGKGGVGKSNIALNLGIQLARRHVSTLLLDADFGLANTDILLNVAPLTDWATLADQRRPLEDSIIDGPAGLKVICGISDPTERRVGAAADPLICVNILERLQYTSEVVLVDCSAGVSSLVTSLALAGDRLLLVTTPEPTALADAYALLKLIHLKGFAGRVGLVVNMAGHRVAQDAFRRLERTARQFLQLDVQNWGAVPLDRHVTTAVSKRVPVVARYPRCPASLALAEIARQLVPPRISTRNHGMWTRVASLFL